MAEGPENQTRLRNVHSSRWEKHDPPTEHRKTVCRAKGRRFSTCKQRKRSTERRTQTRSLRYFAQWLKNQTSSRRSVSKSSTMSTAGFTRTKVSHRSTGSC